MQTPLLPPCSHHSTLFQKPSILPHNPNLSSTFTRAPHPSLVTLQNLNHLPRNLLLCTSKQLCFTKPSISRNSFRKHAPSSFLNDFFLHVWSSASAMQRFLNCHARKADRNARHVHPRERMWPQHWWKPANPFVLRSRILVVWPKTHEAFFLRINVN